MVTSRCRTQPRTHISSLIAGHYSDRLLEAVDHYRSLFTRLGSPIHRGSGKSQSPSDAEPRPKDYGVFAQRNPLLWLG